MSRLSTEQPPWTLKGFTNVLKAPQWVFVMMTVLTWPLCFKVVSRRKVSNHNSCQISCIVKKSFAGTENDRLWLLQMWQKQQMSWVQDGNDEPKVSWNPLVFLIRHTAPCLQLELTYSAVSQCLNSTSLKYTRFKPHFQGGFRNFPTSNSSK